MAAAAAVVVGGAGALGTSILKSMKSFVPSNLNKIISVDFRHTLFAEDNIILRKEDTWEDQFLQLRNEIAEKIKDCEVGCFINVAGSFVLDETDSVASAELNWKMNVQPAYSTILLAKEHLKPGGLLLLTGALGAFNKGISFATSYGMAKAATHSLALSTNDDEIRREQDWNVVCILPNIINTEANRRAMPTSDFSKWTTPDEISMKIRDWVLEPQSRPKDVFVQV